MEELREAERIAGAGIERDRYATGLGHFSSSPHPFRQVTLTEAETLEALERDRHIKLPPVESRRDLVTREVPLNHLAGSRFRVGEAVLRGGRPNRPCKYLAELLGKKLMTPLLNRAGLNCEILRGGIIRPDDRLLPEG